MNLYEHTITDDDNTVTITLDKTYEFPICMNVRNSDYMISVELSQKDLDRLALVFKEAARYERNFDDSKVNKN